MSEGIRRETVPGLEDPDRESVESPLERRKEPLRSSRLET